MTGYGIRLIAALALLISWLGAGSGPTAAESRVALVIGNSNYGPGIGKLLNPANDAKLMAQTLQGVGFSVDLVLDADQKAMKRAVKGFGAKLREAGPAATGLFYYAGHGVQVDGTNYLLPVGAEIAAEADVEIESIAADDVMTQMQSAGNAVNLVFLDACRNNPLAKANRSGTRGLARLDAPRGSFVGYSTAPGDVAADGTGANSPYALALAEELKKPGISVDEAHRNVRAKVLAATGNQQTPWDSSSLTGPVVLLEKVAAQPAAEPAPVPQPQVQQQAAVDKEVVFWESIKDSKNPAEFEAYIKKYPDGTFADLAKAKIENLQAPAVLPQSTQPAQPAQQSASQQIGQPGTKLRVAADVADFIELYLRNAESQTGKYWALAISHDGQRAERAGCERTGWTGRLGCVLQGAGGSTQDQANSVALKACGADCMLLYAGTSKVAAVEIVSASQEPSLPQAQAEQPPAAPDGDGAAATQEVAAVQSGAGETNSVTRILVTADAKGEIDDYRQNASAGGRYWALAISKDGSRVHSVSCGLLNGNGITARCNESGASQPSQQLTDKLALRDCGGPSNCILLYSGDKRVANVEIVAQ